MTVKNGFEGGTNAVTITPANSGGVSGTAPTATVHVAPTVLVFDNSVAAHGNFSVLITTGTGNAVYLEFDFTASTVAVRAYIYFDTLPGELVRIIDIRNATGTILRLQTTAANKFQVQEGGGTTQAFTMGLTLQARNWYRAELVVSNISASAGGYKFDYYDLDSTTPKEAGLNKTAGNLGTTAIAKIVYGSFTTTTTPFTFHMDDIAYNPSSVIYIGPEDQPPVSNAGPDQTVNQGDTVTLDGTASFDPDLGDTFTYFWAHVSGPNPSGLSSTTSPTPSYVATNAGTDTWSLVVTDNHGVPSTVNVVSVTAGAPDFEFQVKRSGVWDYAPLYAKVSGVWEQITSGTAPGS